MASRTRSEAIEEAGHWQPIAMAIVRVWRAVQEITLGQGSATLDQLGPLVQGATTTAAPVQVTDTTNPLSLTTDGRLRVETTPAAVAAVWDVIHRPATATKPVATQAAAGVGIMNICTGFIVTLAAPGLPSPLPVEFVVRDGATGAGTIRVAVTLGLSKHVDAITPATTDGGAQQFSIMGLRIAGTANTAMTLESVAAPGTGNIASVTMFGTTGV